MVSASKFSSLPASFVLAAYTGIGTAVLVDICLASFLCDYLYKKRVVKKLSLTCLKAERG